MGDFFIGTGRLLALGAVMLALSGCVFFIPDKIHYTWEDAGAGGSATGLQSAAPSAQPDRAGASSPFVGLAFSGGGSRAAVFAAAGAEALQREGVLSRVTHISSVSGGSMAAAYLAAMPPEACSPDDDACMQAYFADYQAAMRTNYLWPMETRQLINPNRFLDPNRRANSLRESFDKLYLDNRRFGDLPGSRVLLINAASYDDGRRFVFSNAALRPVDATRSPWNPLSRELLQARSFSLNECTVATPDDFPLSLAVAASAAFPPALGPVTIEAAPGCGTHAPQYWHLGDGGILENTGVETLQEVFLRDNLTGHAPDRGVIFSFDAGKKELTEDSLSNNNLRLWTRNPGQVVAITNIRGDAYWSMVWERLHEERGFDLPVITITYTDHVPESWPASCGRGQRRSESIGAHLRQVPTRFSITECDADLMAASARLGVARALADRAEALSWLAE